jgi:hypothetical protein
MYNIRCLLWSLVLGFSTTVLAHPADEYVQAAYIELGTAIRLELDLTPGEQVAAQVLRQIDSNQNQNFEPVELQTYAKTVLTQLQLSLNGQKLRLDLVDVQPPKAQVFLDGGGTIKIYATTALPSQARTYQLEFNNQHMPVKSGYLANVFVQSKSLRVIAQKRNETQSRYWVEFEQVSQAPTISVWIFPVLIVMLWAVIWGIKKRFS